VRGAFRVAWWHKVVGRRVLLVDDVKEASRTLLAAGVAAIYVATVARSDPDW
jgi:predicted amidophosphoribosyltransferase